jgi:hypothetical protein
MRALVLPLTALLLLAGSSQAAAKSKREPLEDAAKKACAAGEFRKGVEILADLYVRTDDPVFVFNQGRCYEQNHQWTSAIDRFREYTRKAQPSDAGAVAEAEKHIAECELYRERDEAKSQPPALSPSPPIIAASSPNPPPSAAQETPVQTVPVPVSPTVKNRSALPAAGIVIGSLGLASVAAAVVLNLKANQLADSGNEANQSAYKNGALVCYAAGGAALATGIVLWLVGQDRNETRSDGLALLPLWTPGEAVLALGGRF